MYDIKEHTGDITSVTQGIIVHGCNAQGRMASGVAKAIRAKWPGAYDAYMRDFEAGRIKLGSVSYYFGLDRDEDNVVVCNAITQEFYGYDGKQYASYEAVQDCFLEIMARYFQSDDIHFPLIGCGLGGLRWHTVRPLITDVAERSSFCGTLNLWRLPE